MPQVIYLRLPVIMTALLVINFAVISALMAWSAGRAIGTGGIAGAFAAAACITILDWANYTIVPFWGTAQSLARSWSAYPSLILFQSLTGMPGTVFLVASLSALVAVFAGCRTKRWRVIAAACAVLLAAVTINICIGMQKPVGFITVAAIGWPYPPDGPRADEAGGFESLFAGPIAKAAASGACLIVTPEAGLAVASDTRQRIFGVLSNLAEANRVWLVAGYIDYELEENRLAVFSPEGRAELTYSKTHVIPWLEPWNKGTGAVAATRMDDIWLGGMICNDDNFTDISRRHSREGTQVMAVPTLDWQRVSTAHLSNSLHRPIESGYAIVRATAGGISVIADARGRVLARMNHITEGPGYIVAEIPVYRGGTFYGTAGNWMVWAAAIYAAVYLIVRTAGRRKSPSGGSHQLDRRADKAM
ncbi:MAG TPA: nitrilase-related carbon-nitrogen hydrolase [Sedimentisphaerales bacterium]|nr:nitrilase-related carbon-nitrogen hydrolase [Sedimentisphaerales bacterium]